MALDIEGSTYQDLVASVVSQGVLQLETAVTSSGKFSNDEVGMWLQVKRKQVALLEFIMKSCPRENIALMARRFDPPSFPIPISSNPFSSLSHPKSVEIVSKGISPGFGCGANQREVPLAKHFCDGIVGVVRNPGFVPVCRF